MKDIETMIMSEHINNCSFCGKSDTQVQEMIAGPGNILICGECIDLHRKTLEDQSVALIRNPAQRTGTQPEITTSNTPYTCSFCGKSQDQVQRMVAGPGNFYICDECIDLRRKTLEDEWAALNPGPDLDTSS